MISFKNLSIAKYELRVSSLLFALMNAYIHIFIHIYIHTISYFCKDVVCVIINSSNRSFSVLSKIVKLLSTLRKSNHEIQHRTPFVRTKF